MQEAFQIGYNSIFACRKYYEYTCTLVCINVLITGRIKGIKIIFFPDPQHLTPCEYSTMLQYKYDS